MPQKGAVAICCRTSVSPLDKEIARSILTIGQFYPTHENRNYWERPIPEENCTVTAELEMDSLVLRISPAIADHEGHHGKRITAGVYFEIAQRYSEKIGGGRIIQLSNVGQCVVNGVSVHVLAEPGEALVYERICPGFREVLLFDESGR